MFVHGNNLAQKEAHPSKYRDKESRKYLAEIRRQYDIWRKANETLIGPQIALAKKDIQVVEDRVRLVNEYKDRTAGHVGHTGGSN